jgi:4-aminobutyrate aminotransferase-like enzyme
MMVNATERLPGDTSTIMALPLQPDGLGDYTCRVRTLNDQLRQTFAGGKVLMTAGVQALSACERAELLQQVRSFGDFSSGNDPHGEHDFGRVSLTSGGYFWKIEYYSTDLQAGSPDPADEGVTTRVMTIMREDEY